MIRKTNRKNKFLSPYILSHHYPEITIPARPGDVIAFSGSGLFSSLIRLKTYSNISHVGVMLDEYNIIESTSLRNFSGVVIHPLGNAIYDYSGTVWWLPLSDATRRNADIPGLQSWLRAQDGKPYDTLQAAAAGMFTVRAKERLNKLFCSELVAAGFEKFGITDPLNASETAPNEVCSLTHHGLSIYKTDYFQLKPIEGPLVAMKL